MRISFSFLFLALLLSFSSLSAQTSDNFNELMDTLKDRSSTLIIYSVQVGAFKSPKNPKKGHYEGVEHLFSKKYDDKFNRFFSGLFKSIGEAITHCDELRAKGYQDSFVLGLDGGFDRILIEID
jgi:hypothetical protein